MIDLLDQRYLVLAYRDARAAYERCDYALAAQLQMIAQNMRERSIARTLDRARKGVS